MKKILFPVLVAAGALVTPNVAAAQEAEPFIGVSAGYHDLVLHADSIAINEDDGVIFGAVAGVDFPIGDTFFIGAEGNYHFGTDAIDSEYGVAARLGVKIDETVKLYVRGGYQEVELDLDSVFGANLAPADLDDTDGDYIVGAGADFGLGVANSAIRLGIDTIGFDTVRGTAGFVLNF